MTIESTSNDGITHNGNSSTTNFSFPFKVNKASQVEVIITDADGNDGDPLTTNFTVNDFDTEGSGSVDYPTSGDPLPTGQKITINPSMDYLQQTDLRNQGRFDPEVHERVMDTLMMHIKELRGLFNKTIRFRKSSGIVGAIFGDNPVDGKSLAWDGTTGLIKNGPSIDDINNVSGNAAQVTADRVAVEGYKTDIETLKTQVETLYDGFDDRYLGSKTSDPTVDNDGNPLLDGTLYYNETSNLMRVYDLGNTQWNDVTTALLDGSVTTSKLAALAVTTAKIAANAVSLGKLAQISTQTFLGRKTAGTGDVEALTAAEMRTELDVYNKSESDALGVSINTSPLQDITANTWVTYAHSIGSEPVAWGVNLVCKTASDGYAVGEKILSPLIPLPPTASGGGHYDSGAYVDDTNFGAILGTHFIQDKGTLVSSAITHANWQFEFWWIA